MMTKTEKKIKPYPLWRIKPGAELRRAMKMLKAIQRARQEMEARKAKEIA